MSSNTTFNPQVIGQAEKALNAILERELAPVGLSEPQWVTLTLAVTGGGAQLVTRVAHALKGGEAGAQADVASLISAQLLDREGVATAAGLQLHARIRTRVVQITQQMWGDLPVEDLDAAGRVLAIVLARANAELDD